MTDMMKGVKDSEDISPSTRMAICKSYNSMGKDMMSQVANCKSIELKTGLMRAKMLCAAKPGSGSGGKKPVMTKKPAPSKLCSDVAAKVGVFYAYVCDYVYVRVRARERRKPAAKICVACMNQ